MIELDIKQLMEVGTLIIAVIVAWTGLRAGKTAEKAAEAQLDAVHASVIGQAIDDYQRLGRDMATLIDWYRETKEEGADFLQVYANDRVGVDHISAARRNVRLYFQKCAQLLDSGSISPKVFEVIAYKKGLNVLHRIVIPLEQMKLHEKIDFYSGNPAMLVYQKRPFNQWGDGHFTFERLNR